MGQGFGGLSGAAPFGNTAWGLSLQVAMLRSPEFRAALEKILGGSVLPNGGSADGALRVWRGAHPRVGGLMRAAMQQNVMPRGAFASTIGSMNIPMAGNPMVQQGGPMSSVLKGLQAMEANVMSTVQGFSGGQGQGSGMQAMAQKLGINMQNANFEDIIYLSMMNYASNQEKKISGSVNGLAGNPAGDTRLGPAGNPFLGAGGAAAAHRGAAAPGRGPSPASTTATARPAAAHPQSTTGPARAAAMRAGCRGGCAGACQPAAG